MSIIVYNSYLALWLERSASSPHSLIASSPQTMLFHEALHLVFATFSRRVLQQGHLTAYLADCGVFDTFDDRRTICLTIDHRYGARLYTCLSHSPYKQQFDAILAEVKLLHPTIDPQQVDYVFQSIRFAWGKIKSVRPPKPLILFAPPKKKRSRQSPIANRLKSAKGAQPLHPTPYTLHQKTSTGNDSSRASDSLYYRSCFT